jgi:hypothetical protein
MAFYVELVYPGYAKYPEVHDGCSSDTRHAAL